MIVPIIAVTLAQLGSSTPVTVTINSCPVPDAVSQLAQITHLPLKATKAADYGSLMVCVRDYPTDKLLERVANDLGARWEQEGSILYLKPDEAKLKAIAALGLQKRMKAWNKEITGVATAGTTGLSSQNKGEDTAEANHRAFARILAAIPAEQIVNIRPLERVVYSLNPTAMQKPFPEAAARLVRVAMKEHPKFPNRTPQYNPTPPKTAILVIAKDVSLETFLSARLYMYDKSGNVTNIVNYTGMEGRTDPTPMAPSSNPDDYKPIEIDECPLTQFVSDARTNKNPVKSEMNGSGDPFYRLLDNVSNLLSDPVTNEPTRVLSDNLIALARHENAQLVGWVPDSSVFNSFYSAPTSNTPFAIRNGLLSGSDLLVLKNGTDEDITPTDPELDKSEYVKRPELKAALAFYKSIDHLGLKAYLELGNYIKSRDLPGMILMCLISVSSQSAISLYNLNWDMIHLLDSLDSEDLSKLYSGGTLSTSNFTSQQQALLHNYIFGSQEPRILAGSEDSLDNSDPNLNAISITLSNFGTEITNSLPNGVPESIRIHFTTRALPGFRTYHDPSAKHSILDYMELPESVKDLADYYFNAQGSSAGANSSSTPQKMSPIEVGSITTYVIYCHLKENMTAESHFLDYDFTGAAHYEVGHLPPQFQKEWDDQMTVRKNGGPPNRGFGSTGPG